MNGYGRGILGLPPVVKNIIMINVLMLLAYYAAGSVFGVDLNSLLGLYFPKSEQFKPLQIVTHMFMHGGFMHIFFNMYALFIFGPILENVWGPKRFFIFYMVCGLGAAFTHEFVIFFQYHHLLPDFTALENVMMPLLIAGKNRKEAKEIAEKLLKEVGLADRMDHRPNELSGGQNQRVAVARALSCSPAIVLGDEPTGNLDTKAGDLIYELLRRLNKEYNQTFIVVTHNEDLASKADKIIRLVDGKITDQ